MSLYIEPSLTLMKALCEFLRGKVIRKKQKEMHVPAMSLEKTDFHMFFHSFLLVLRRGFLLVLRRALSARAYIMIAGTRNGSDAVENLSWISLFCK